jgi:hypothetical protein
MSNATSPDEHWLNRYKAKPKPGGIEFHDTVGVLLGDPERR